MKINSFKYEKIHHKTLTPSHEYVNSTTRAIFFSATGIFGVQEVTNSPKIVYLATLYKTDADHQMADGV